jgi:hypothetical protein
MPAAINNDGIVVGWSTSAAVDVLGQPIERPVLWGDLPAVLPAMPAAPAASVHATPTFTG